MPITYLAFLLLQYCSIRSFLLVTWNKSDYNELRIKKDGYIDSSESQDCCYISSFPHPHAHAHGKSLCVVSTISHVMLWHLLQSPRQI